MIKVKSPIPHNESFQRWVLIVSQISLLLTMFRTVKTATTTNGKAYFNSSYHLHYSRDINIFLLHLAVYDLKTWVIYYCLFLCKHMLQFL